jgi:hypothetical protein
MDVLKALAEKAFWGHEFLTWLWFSAEEAGGELDAEGFGPLTLWIVDRIVLGSLETESKENILKDGDVSRSAEAAAALTVGKKLQEARFGLIREDREWTFTLKGDTFDLQGVKIPAVTNQEGDDVHATILLRLGYIRELTDVLDALFARFVRLRTSPAWDAETVPALAQWIGAKEGG